MRNLFLKFCRQGLKKHLLSLITSNQTAYLDKKFKSEGGRLISDILEITDLLKIKALLLTVDIKKGFDSVDHQFLINVKKKNSNRRVTRNFLGYGSFLGIRALR